MSYWSDEAVQKRAAEAELMRLAWKFRGITTGQLEMRLENNGMPEISRKDIEHELVRRGATYIKRSYYDRPSKFFGSDGSELIIATAGEGVGKPIYDWDRMVAAESAYIDEVLAKPIPKVSGADMSTFLESQKVLIRRVVPGLISMDSISSGVQPLNKHIDHLSIFKGLKSPFEDYKLTAEDANKIIAADKDLQQVTPHFWSDRISQQSIGRGLRPTVKYGDLHIRDYMGLIHSNEPPKTNIGLSLLMDSLRENGSTQESFFDTESTFNSGIVGGDFFSKVDTSKWIADCKAIMDTYIDDAMAVKRPYYADVYNDEVSRMYPNTLTDIDLSLSNKCMEVPITPIMKGTEITSSFSEVWRLQMEAMKKSAREMYYSNPFKVVTAEAPRYKESRVMAGVSEGIYPVRKVDAGFYHCPYIPERLSSKELRGGWELDEMIVLSAPTPKEKSVMTMQIAKDRKHDTTGKGYVEFDPDYALNWAKWSDEGTVKKTKEEDVAETLKLLGIGAEE